MNKCKTIWQIIGFFFLSVFTVSLAVAGVSPMRSTSARSAPAKATSGNLGVCAKKKELDSRSRGQDRASSPGTQEVRVQIVRHEVAGKPSFDMNVVKILAGKNRRVTNVAYKGLECFSDRAADRFSYFCKGLDQNRDPFFLMMEQGEAGFQLIWNTMSADRSEFIRRSWGDGFDCSLEKIIPPPVEEDSEDRSRDGVEVDEEPVESPEEPIKPDDPGTEATIVPPRASSVGSTLVGPESLRQQLEALKKHLGGGATEQGGAPNEDFHQSPADRFEDTNPSQRPPLTPPPVVIDHSKDQST